MARRKGRYGSRTSTSALATQGTYLERRRQQQACHGQNHRVRQPEGRGGEDDDDPEPRRRLQGAGVERPCGRPRPAGEPDHEPGPQSGRDRTFDVRRARAPAADRASDPGARGRRRRFLDRPRRRRARAFEHDRARGALEKALVPVRENYNYILIDTPPSLGILTVNALVAADGVIVPVQCEYLSLRGLVQLENTLSMIRENLNPNVQIEGILPTMYDRRTLHSREAIDILEENFGELVFDTKIRKTIRYAEAPVKGTSVLAYDPTGDAANAYRKLAKEVLNGSQAG